MLVAMYAEPDAWATYFLEEQGVTLNGLAILTDFPTLDIWYRNHVITGTGSFVISARDFEDFGAAIREKILRETAFQVSEHRQMVPGRLAQMAER